MRNILIILAALTVFGGCKKAPDNATGTDKIIFGRLFLIDTITQNALNTPLAKKKVLIRAAESTDTVNYLFSATTTDDGYFSFKNLTEGKKYSVSYSEMIGSVLYTAEAEVRAPYQQMALYARIDLQSQKGILFTVRDQSGNLIKSAEICLFTSSTNPGYANQLCEGSSLQLKTDGKGRVMIVDLQRISYYSLSSSTVFGTPLISQDTIQVNDTVTKTTIILKKPNGLRIHTLDANGEVISNASSCVFTSRILFDKGSCEGSNYQLMSNTVGIAEKFALPKGNYYIFSRKIIGKDTLQARSSITVGNDVTELQQHLTEK